MVYILPKASLSYIFFYHRICFDLSEYECTIHLGDENSGNGLVQSSSIHVDCRSHWKNESSHTFVDVKVLLKTPESNRESRGAEMIK